MACCASSAVAKTMKPKHFEPGLFALVTTFAVTTCGKKVKNKN